MNEMDTKTEGQLLSEEYGLSGQTADAGAVEPPARTAEAVALEIRTLQRQAQGIILSYAIEIGRRLEEAKAMLPHGEWGAWLKNELDYSQSTAQNFMKVFREYGDNQQSMFGGAPKSQTFGNLTYSKALRLLAIPDEEERARFVEENDVEHMTTRELNEALRARDAAQEAAAAAEDEAARLRQETDRLREELSDQDRVYKAKLTAADVETTEANRKAREAQEALEKQREKAQRLQDALSEANTSAQAAEEEHARLARELAELRSRPAEADTAAVEAARQAAIAEMTEKVDKAKEAMKRAEETRKTTEAKCKAAEESLEAAQRELADLKAKGPEVRELTQEEKDALTAEAVSKAKAEGAEQIRSLEKKLAAADPDVAEFKVRWNAWREEHQKMMEVLNRIAQANEEQAAKLRNAVKAALEQMA